MISAVSGRDPSTSSCARTSPTIQPGQGSAKVEKRPAGLAFRIDLRFLADTQPLTTDEQVVQATLKNLFLMARTHVEHNDPHLSAVIEYPVKTMNVCEKTTRFQVDTGPLLWPEFASKESLAVQRFALAFICYNTYADGEAVLRVPTPILVDGRSVSQAWHYSKIVPIKARHELFCVGKL
jgi:hypothetical protein